MMLRIVLLLACLLTACSDPGSIEVKPERTAPLVHPVTPRTGEWTGSNQLGNQISFEHTSQNRQRVLFMPEWGPPERWTINLGIDHKVLGNNENFEVIGHIQYGVGGTTQTVSVDWSEGCTLSVVANTITITAEWLLTLPLSNPSVDLRAMVGRGNSSYPTNATLSQSFSLANGNSSAIIQIPAMARRARVVSSDDPDTVYNAASYLKLVAQSAGGGQAVYYHGDVLKSTAGEGLPIPWFVKYYFFHNASGGGSNGIVVFDIEP